MADAFAARIMDSLATPYLRLLPHPPPTLPLPMRKRGVLLDGDRLVQLYQRKGWNQQVLARKAGLDSRTITKVRRGGACDASTLQLLATALGVDPETLLVPSPSETTSPSTLDSAEASNELESGHLWSQSHRILQAWKIIDLRHFPLPNEERYGIVWEKYRVLKLKDESPPIVFPYLTWGDRIECLSKPDSTHWRRVPVSPGDLVHSEKQWELIVDPPEGNAGTEFDCGPFQIQFVEAFHGESQQWWQVRVAYEIQSLIVQVLFSKEQPCLEITGTCAMPGQTRFSQIPGNEPFLLTDGSVASWQFQNPPIGAFYKLSWRW